LHMGAEAIPEEWLRRREPLDATLRAAMR